MFKTFGYNTEDERRQAGTDSKGHLIDSAGPKLSYHLEETSITAQRTRKILQDIDKAIRENSVVTFGFYI